MEKGYVISELRYKKGWTQTDLAEKLAVTKGAIALWETNKRNPPLEKLIALADIFDVSTDFLLGRVCDENDSTLVSTSISSAVSRPSLSENSTMLLENYEKLNKEDQAYILGKTIELVREQKKAEADAPALKKAN